MAFKTINGNVVHYELIGEAKAKNLIVFSNGLGTDFRIWLPLFDELGDDVSVLLYDSRGHGLSGGADKPFGMADLVSDLASLCDELGIRKATFCGLSVGGLVCQGLWKERPDLFRKLILCDTAPRIGSAEIWAERIAGIEKGGLESAADSAMARWFTPAFHEDRPDELAGYRLMMTRQSIAGYLSTCAALRDTDFSDVLPTITVPTLFVVGDQDGSTPPATVQAGADLVPGARFEEIADCAHIPSVEQPEALAELIQGFMRKQAN
ncbi:3-oxoadipate enol-lactonase [Rhizobium rosettiformans]|uniref:3-oxoadipate enol-lactonase n=2 Tax=Rhizobium rosettiformans TaxID=1368430 RepID=A0A4S8PY50_9HYPH|nr:3-oxoadipate enol-lactonase [Rhizobium rosettiformans]MBB5275982.1 3-oxoadipate enol-lactonase [Rhizobium rosettiformans]THV36637.1 3-oxoadipate enol-lactonase [Rhizobium rosettiformans W3]